MEELEKIQEQINELYAEKLKYEMEYFSLESQIGKLEMRIAKLKQKAWEMFMGKTEI